MKKFRVETTTTAQALFNLFIDIEAENEQDAVDKLESLSDKDIINNSVMYLTKKLQVDSIEGLHLLNENTRIIPSA